MSDSLTIVLDGEVMLDDFAKAVVEFHGLIGALTADVAGGARIEWLVDSLATSSAIATIRGRGEAEPVERVVRAYEEVGEALEQHRPIPYSKAVAERAMGLVGIINGHIEDIRFETDQRDAIVRKETGKLGPLKLPPPPAPAGTFGAVEGIVETLSQRHGLRFTLYDRVFDKAVSCYLTPGMEGVMREMWGKMAVVVGVVSRDALTGRALSVRQITQIEPVVQRGIGEWRKARGVAPARTDEPPEATIRAMRDA